MTEPDRTWRGGWTPLPVVAALLLVLMIGHPVIALAAGAALALTLDRELLPGQGRPGRWALQSAIVLLGLQLNMTQLARIGADYSLLVTAYVLVTLGTGLMLGRLVRNPPTSSRLIAAGTAICGGTTVASLSPVIRSRPEDTGVALALMFLLNAAALLSFPAIGHLLQMSQEQFGVWAALAIHDTSSVVATSALYGAAAAKIATTVKLGRTLWLVPVLIAYSIPAHRGLARPIIPPFIVLFVLAALLASVASLPTLLVTGAANLSRILLTAALFCIGTQINRATLRNLRGTAVLQGLLLWGMVVPVTLAIVMCTVQ